MKTIVGYKIPWMILKAEWSMKSSKVLNSVMFVADIFPNQGFPVDWWGMTGLFPFYMSDLIYRKFIQLLWVSCYFSIASTIFHNNCMEFSTKYLFENQNKLTRTYWLFYFNKSFSNLYNHVNLHTNYFLVIT